MGVFSSIADGWRNFHSRLRTDADFRDEISLMSQAFLSTTNPGEALGTSAALIRAAREEKAQKKLEADLRAAAEAKDASRYADLLKERDAAAKAREEERAARVADGIRDDAFRDEQGRRAEAERKAAAASRAEELRLRRITTEDSLATGALQRQNYQSEMAARQDPVRMIAGMSPAQIIAADAALQADPSQMGFMPLDPRREAFAPAAEAMRGLPTSGGKVAPETRAAQSYIRSDLSATKRELIELPSKMIEQMNTPENEAALQEATQSMTLLDVASRSTGGEAITNQYLADKLLLTKSSAGPSVVAFLGRQPDNRLKTLMRDGKSYKIVYLSDADLAQ